MNPLCWSGIRGSVALLSASSEFVAAAHLPITANSHAGPREITEPDLLAVISLVVSFFALTISAGRLIRRPKISAFWKEDDPSGGRHQPLEYVEIVVTARQRGLDLREIGLLSLQGRPPLLRRMDEAALLTDTHHRMALDSEPTMLPDGGSRRTGSYHDKVVEEFRGHAGSEYAYVLASGTIYLKKTKTLRQHSGGPARILVRRLLRR